MKTFIILALFIAFLCAFSNYGTLSTTSDVGHAAAFNLLTTSEGSAYEQRTVTTLAEDASVQESTIMFQGESTGSLHGKKLYLYSVDSTFMVYFDVGGIISPQINKTGYYSIPVTISKNDSAGAVMTAFKNKLNTSYPTHFSVSGTGSTATVDNAKVGYSAYTASSESTFTISALSHGLNGLKNKYFNFGVGANNYSVWFNSNGNGTAPSTGYTNKSVTTAIGDTAAQVAAKIVTALSGISGISASALSNVITITDTSYVSSMDIADGKNETGFTFNTVTQGSPGVLNNKYFTFYAGNNSTGYYGWYNVASGGTDPAIIGLTAVPIAINAADSSYSIATSTANAVGALSSMTASASTNVVTITAKTQGETTQPSVGTTPFALHQITDGVIADPVVVKDIPCGDSTVANIYSITTSAITSAPTLTLQVSPISDGNIWVSTTTTITPSTSLNGTAIGTPASISATRCRVITSAAPASGAATVYLSGSP